MAAPFAEEILDVLTAVPRICTPALASAISPTIDGHAIINTLRQLAKQGRVVRVGKGCTTHTHAHRSALIWERATTAL